MPYRAVIADDHPFTVAGMNSLLDASADFTVIATAHNGIEAIAIVKRLQPDIALLDLAMPGANGLETFLEARRWSPATRFAVITGISALSLFQTLVDAGIDGLFVKNAPPDDILAGLRAIMAGERHFAPEAREALKSAGGGEQFSNREMQVLQELARGLSNAQIAAKLGVSPKTIDSHRTSLLRKMQVNSTAALLVSAMRHGLIEV